MYLNRINIITPLHQFIDYNIWYTIKTPINIKMQHYPYNEYKLYGYVYTGFIYLFIITEAIIIEEMTWSRGDNQKHFMLLILNNNLNNNMKFYKDHQHLCDDILIGGIEIGTIHYDGMVMMVIDKLIL